VKRLPAVRDLLRERDRAESDLAAEKRRGDEFAARYDTALDRSAHYRAIAVTHEARLHAIADLVYRQPGDLRLQPVFRSILILADPNGDRG
jgi:hypothetical protein